jgi:hypothetical protein
MHPGNLFSGSGWLQNRSNKRYFPVLTPPETVMVPSGRFPNTKPVQSDSITVRPRQSSVTESAACSRLLEGSSHDHVSTVQALRQEKANSLERPSTLHLSGAIKL